MCPRGEKVPVSGNAGNSALLATRRPRTGSGTSLAQGRGCQRPAARSTQTGSCTRASGRRAQDQRRVASKRSRGKLSTNIQWIGGRTRPGSGCCVRASGRQTQVQRWVASVDMVGQAVSGANCTWGFPAKKEWEGPPNVVVRCKVNRVSAVAGENSGGRRDGERNPRAVGRCQ